MCEKCDDIENRVREAIKASGVVEDGRRQDDESARKAGIAGGFAAVPEDRRIAMVPLVLFRTGIQMMIDDGADPQAILQAITWITQPVIEACGGEEGLFSNERDAEKLRRLADRTAARAKGEAEPAGWRSLLPKGKERMH